jgi:serine/threonine protein phosphatase PrpC
MLTVGLRSHAGAVRSTNEDSVIWDPELSLLAVADGMGGHKAGEVASRLAVDALRTFLEKSAASQDCTWPFGVNPMLSLEMNRLLTAVRLANRRIFRESEERIEYTGMGTTVVAALALDAHVSFVSIGDSRLYLVLEHDLQQLSRDDSFVTLLSAESGLDPSAFAHHPMRHVLTNVVGARPELEVTGHEFDLQDGQVFLMCSDGLYGALSADHIHRVVTNDDDLEQAAEALIQAAVDAECDDNVSVLLARYTSER